MSGSVLGSERPLSDVAAELVVGGVAEGKVKVTLGLTVVEGEANGADADDVTGEGRKGDGEQHTYIHVV